MSASGLDFDESSIVSSPTSEPISLVGHMPTDEPCRLSSRSNTELELDSLWHELHSVVPLLKLLPGLKDVNGYYVLNGEIEHEYIERVKFHAKKVKKFLFAEATCPVVAPSAYLRLFQVLRGPLFPFINDLRLSSSSTILPYISVLLCSSLVSVEMDIISSADTHLYEPFFTMLPSEAPLLERLILRGPDILPALPASSLEFVSQCTNLRSLELLDVVRIQNWGLVQSIGTLPHLEDLIVITRDLEYKSDVAILASGGFCSLQKLTVTAPFLLIRDLIRCIRSNIKTVNLTPIIDIDLLFVPARTEPERLAVTPEPHPPSFALPSVYDLESPPTPPSTCSLIKKKKKKGKGELAYEENIGKKKKKKGTGEPETEPTYESIIQEQITYPMSVAVEPTPCDIVQEQVTPPAIEDPNANGWLALLQQIFEVATVRWNDSLHSLTLSLRDAHEPTLIPRASQTLELPSDLVQSWGRFCNLQTLYISFWKLPSVDDVLVPLTDSWPQLHSLCLPLEPYGNSMSLGSLRPLARHCPNLREVQASIDVDISFDKIIPVKSTGDYALKHRLGILSVGSTTTPKRVLTIGRYINILFPHLKMLETHEGHNEEHWKEIADVVKLCQNVRDDDSNRV